MHHVISVIQYCLHVFLAVLQGDTYNLQYGYDTKYVLTSRKSLVEGSMCEFECSVIGIFRRLLVLIHMYHYLNVVFLRFLQVVHICLIHLFFLKTEDNSWCTCCFYSTSTLILHCSQEIQLLYNICFYFLLFSVICDLFTKLLICNYTVLSSF